MREIGLASALALTTIAFGVPAQAQPADDAVEPNSIWNLEQRVWGGVVRGLGLKDPNAPVIDYRERSPLVVPPTRDLPPPQARAAPRDPAWPNDPDVAKARNAQEAKGRMGGGNARSALESQGRPISPDELNRGVPRQQRDNPSGSNAPASGAEGAPVLPSQLGYFGGLFSGRAWGFGAYKDEVGTFTGEPPRATLTEPPPGYQTPSPEHPYGTTKRIERTKTEQWDPAGRNY